MLYEVITGGLNDKMAQLPRYVSKQLARMVSAKRLFKSNTPVFLPFYHTVSNQSLPHILSYNFV